MSRVGGLVEVWWAPLANKAYDATITKILGVYGVEPPFDRSPTGKPAPRGRPDLSFNLAHSEAWLVLAIADEAEVGVDCEAIRPFPELMQVARDVCSSAERDVLADADQSDVLGLFLEMWTRKEAVAKAIGQGLGLPLERLVVGGATSDLARIDAGEHGQWWLRSLAAPLGYAAACACDRPFEAAVRQWPFGSRLA